MPVLMRVRSNWLRAAGLGALVFMLLSGRAQEASKTLYGQAAQAMLDRDFPTHGVEYVLLDAQTRQPLAMRWANPGNPAPMGSAIKPFVALAFSRMQGLANGGRRGKLPVVVCHGKPDGCWRAEGHGPLGLERALAESCNAYFLAIARNLVADPAGPAALKQVSAEYGLPGPPQPETPGRLIGVTPEWRVKPVDFARAYATLASKRGSAAGDGESETTDRLLTGMKLAAAPGGTAAKVGAHPGGVLAKTGTAPCVPDVDWPRCLANGDGLVVVMAPAENPRLVLLVRERGTTGAQTAEIAGRMLARIEESNAEAR